MYNKNFVISLYTHLNNKNMEVLLIFFGAIGLALFLIVYGSLSWGFVTYTFYHWFILPSFPNFPPFSVVHFIGFSLFVNSLIRQTSSESIKDEYKDKSTQWSMYLFSPWLLLFFGWLIKIILF